MIDNEDYRRGITSASLTQSIVVQAGPGSGKTTLLIERLKYIIDNRPLSFSGIACITYTNAAKDEIISRLQKEGVQLPTELFVGTIHSFLLEYIIQPYSHFARKDKTTFKLASSGFARGYKSELGNMLNRPSYLLDESTFKAVESLGRDEKGNPFCFKKRISSEVAREWKNFIIKMGYIDQQDVIYLSYLILKKYEHIRKAISYRFPYILVDEFQDVTFYQDKVLSLLEFSVFFFVGDTNQSIYSFTGAKPELFQARINDEKFLYYKLTNNFRSTKHIIKFANLKTDIHQNETGNNATSNQKIIFMKNIEDPSEAIQLFHSIRLKVKCDDRYNPYMILARKNKYLSNLPNLTQKQTIDYHPFLKKLSKVHYRRFKILKNLLLAINSEQVNKFDEAVERMAEALSYLIFNEHPGFVSLDKIGYNNFMWKKLQIFTLNFITGINLKETSIESFFIQLRKFISELSQELYGIAIGNKLRMLDYNWKSQVKAARNTTVFDLLKDSGLSNTLSNFEEHVFSIHGAKGQEAECVLIMAESESQLLEWLGENKESEEARVGYVAFSRARKLLCVWAPSIQEENYKYIEPHIEFVDLSYYDNNVASDKELINS